MKKSKLAIGLVTSLLSVVALTGCNEVSYSNGNILTYNGTTYTARDLFDEYSTSSVGAEAMFDAVYEVIVRNYFAPKGDGYGSMTEITKLTKNDVDGVKSTAQDNADKNKTWYNDEFEKLLDSYNCDDENELYDYFEYKEMTTKFEDKFYEDNIQVLRDGNADRDGYLKEKIPYHVKHILIKVDAAGTNSVSGTISKANAIKIGSVFKDLATGVDTFGQIAKLLSDDTGSAANYGDLGIMDKDTSYVNEFKLGVYAWEALYNKQTSANADRIGMPSDAISFFGQGGEGEIGTLPYGAALKLNEINDVEKDADSLSVNKGEAYFFPRNIYFNKYFNKNTVALVTPNDLNQAERHTTDGIFDNTVTEDFAGKYNHAYVDSSVEGKCGFKDISSLLPAGYKLPGQEGQVAQYALCDENGQVVLAVRAGTSGSSGYQGIHLIVVQRSALIDSITNTKGSTSLSEYYTTYYPGQKDTNGNELFPTYDDGTYKNTYVNYLNQTTSDYKANAEKVKSKIKTYDSLLNTYIYQSYLTKQELKFNDAIKVTVGGNQLTIGQVIENWITQQRANDVYTENKTWEKTWKTYIEYIEQQVEERTTNKLLSETCALQFYSGSKGDAWTKEGGSCYYDAK